MNQSIFTAYLFGLVITVILNIFNLLLNPYLTTEDKLFKNWSYVYHCWIIIIASIIIAFRFPKTALWIQNITTVIYFFLQIRLMLVLNRYHKKYRFKLVLSLIILFLYLTYFSIINNSLFYRAIVNNTIYFILNILLGYSFINLKVKTKLKSIVVLSCFLLASIWISRLVLFFIIENISLTSKNILNLLSIYSIVPLVTLQNISILLFVFARNYDETVLIKKQNINYQNEAIFTSFLKSLFHEINTPLGVAFTASSVYIDNKNINKETKEGFQLIYNSLNKIIELLDDRRFIFGEENEGIKPYLNKTLEEKIVRITKKNFITKNTKLEFNFPKTIYHISIRNVFTIIIFFLELIEELNINCLIKINFKNSSELSFTLHKASIFPMELFTSIELPEDESILKHFDKRISDKLIWLTTYTSTDNNKVFRIIHRNSNEIFEISI